MFSLCSTIGIVHNFDQWDGPAGALWPSKWRDVAQDHQIFAIDINLCYLHVSNYMKPADVACNGYWHLRAAFVFFALYVSQDEPQLAHVLDTRQKGSRFL